MINPNLLWLWQRDKDKFRPKQRNLNEKKQSRVQYPQKA